MQTKKNVFFVIFFVLHAINYVNKTINYVDIGIIYANVSVRFCGGGASVCPDDCGGQHHSWTTKHE